jgi:hypothetical protein
MTSFVSDTHLNLYRGTDNIIQCLQELPLLRPRTHDKFHNMRYDDRYTPLLQRAGLDVVLYQARCEFINPAAITALVDRYNH